MREALTAAHDAAAGLAHMHEVGVAHKDIKPGNLLVFWDAEAGPGGAVAERLRVKLADLGMSRKLEQGPDAADMCARMHARALCPCMHGEG